MSKKTKSDWQPIIGILPDGEVKHVLIDAGGWVFEDPTKPPDEYDTLMMALQILADAREVKISEADELDGRMAAKDVSGVVRYIKLKYADKLSDPQFGMVEYQAIGENTLISVTAKGRYWLEQWNKRKRKYTPESERRIE